MISINNTLYDYGFRMERKGVWTYKSENKTKHIAYLSYQTITDDVVLGTIQEVRTEKWTETFQTTEKLEKVWKQLQREEKLDSLL